MPYIENIRESLDCPVRNCSIGIMIRCTPDELNPALEFGKYEIRRTASYHQRTPDQKGCEHYSTEEAKIFYDTEGNATGYEIPYTDPSLVLTFFVYAGLVPYGANPQELLAGTYVEVIKDDGWRELSNSFSDLMASVYTTQRQLFPPEQVMVDGKAYEAFAICLCHQLNCHLNTGSINIDPLPFRHEKTDGIVTT